MCITQNCAQQGHLSSAFPLVVALCWFPSVSRRCFFDDWVIPEFAYGYKDKYLGCS